MLRSRCLFHASFRNKSTTATNPLPFEAIPGPRPLPLIGNIWRYLPLIGDYNIDELYKNATINRQRYGPIVREQITKKHVVLHLFDPLDVESFFRQDGAEPHRRSHRALLKLRHANPKLYNDGGIFPENGASWARLRGLFNQHLMRKEPIELRTGLLDDITKQTVESLASGGQPGSLVVVEDFARFLQIWTIKCALTVFLDYNRADMPGEQVLERILGSLDDILLAIAGTEIKSDRWVTQPDKCPYFKKLSTAEEFTYEFVRQRIEFLIHHENSFGEPSFVRDWLVGERIDRKDVITFILDCLLASVHTTAYTATFLLENISRRLEKGSRNELQQEIQHRMLPMKETVKRDIFDEMPMLRDCLKETQRLYPVSIGTGRLTQNDMTIRNYQVPSGVMVITHNQLICRDSTSYQEPDKYCPIRWSNYRLQTRSQRPSRFAWLPFGFGPRACLGQRLSNMQIQILVGRLLQNFDIKFADEIKTKTLLVHCLDGKIKVQLQLL